MSTPEWATPDVENLPNQTNTPINWGADPYATRRPPEAGIYEVQIAVIPNEQGNFREMMTKKNEFFGYKFDIIALLVDPAQQGARVYDYGVTTALYNGTSKAIGLVKAIGNPMELAKLKDPHIDIKNFLEAKLPQFANGELSGLAPTCKLKVEWQLRYDTGEKNKEGYAVWKSARYGMHNFPKNADGTYNHMIDTPAGPKGAMAVAERYIEFGKSI